MACSQRHPRSAPPAPNSPPNNPPPAIAKPHLPAALTPPRPQPSRHWRPRLPSAWPYSSRPACTGCGGPRPCRTLRSPHVRARLGARLTGGGKPRAKDCQAFRRGGTGLEGRFSWLRWPAQRGRRPCPGHASSDQRVPTADPASAAPPGSSATSSPGTSDNPTATRRARQIVAQQQPERFRRVIDRLYAAAAAGDDQMPNGRPACDGSRSSLAVHRRDVVEQLQPGELDKRPRASAGSGSRVCRLHQPPIRTLTVEVSVAPSSASLRQPVRQRPAQVHHDLESAADSPYRRTRPAEMYVRAAPAGSRCRPVKSRSGRCAAHSARMGPRCPLPSRIPAHRPISARHETSSAVCHQSKAWELGG
jgi:hypothetical protein